MSCWSGTVEAESDDSGLIWASAEELDENFTLPSAFKAYRPVIKRLLESLQE